MGRIRGLRIRPIRREREILFLCNGGRKDMGWDLDEIPITLGASLHILN